MSLNLWSWRLAVFEAPAPALKHSFDTMKGGTSGMQIVKYALTLSVEELPVLTFDAPVHGTKGRKPAPVLIATCRVSPTRILSGRPRSEEHTSELQSQSNL